MGEMFFYLGLCDRAIVGGGFVSKGAHNIIEPLALRKPVIVGPHTWTITYPVVEAMAAGLPCFATNVSGLNNVICAPYLFEVGDAETLAKKVIDIKDSPSLYQEASNYVVKQAVKFSISTSAIEYARIYNSCIKNA